MSLKRKSAAPEQGQAMVEFGLTVPLFLGLLFGLTAFSVIFYSYVTIALAVREGASSIVHNPKQTVSSIQTQVSSKSFALTQGSLSVTVEPTDNTQWISGAQVSVTAVYTVPLPIVSVPYFSGSSFRIMGPIPLTAVSVMTIE
jgi:Flp pilus assembly protein TadG